MSGFDNPWYAEMLERFSPDKDDDNGNAAHAILAGFCILAVAIDGVSDALIQLSESVEQAGAKDGDA